VADNKDTTKVDDLEKLFNLLRELTEIKFTGNIQINFKSGGIPNINKLESIQISSL